MADPVLLKQAISGSNSIRQVLGNLNLNRTGWNYMALKEHAERFGFDLPVFDFAENARKTSTINGILPLEEALVENSNYNRGRLKRRLIEEGILENKCDECGLGPEWNDRPLTIQIDHRNGINNDNRLDNLHLLCPNCHSQTDTFAGRSARRPPKAKKLRRPRPRKFDPTVEDLKEQLEIGNFSSVGRIHGVSANAVKKRAKLLGLIREADTFTELHECNTPPQGP